MAFSMARWAGKVAVVTGASGGVGANIAERLTKEGLKVAGLARRNDKLETLAKSLHGFQGSFHPIKTDMTKEQDIIDAFKKIKTELGPVHVLVNNAAVALVNSVINGKSEDWRTTLDTNLLGYTYAMREAIDSMNESKVDGHIVNIASVAGHRVVNSPTPFSAYIASKHAVTVLAEVVRFELIHAKSKIKITNISPGMIATEMVPEEYHRTGIKILNPSDISDGIVYVLSTPPHVQIHELMIRPVGEPF